MKCANISPYMRRPLVIYDFATAPFWISLYLMKIWFSFVSVSDFNSKTHFNRQFTFLELFRLHLSSKWKKVRGTLKKFNVVKSIKNRNYSDFKSGQYSDRVLPFLDLLEINPVCPQTVLIYLVCAIPIAVTKAGSNHHGWVKDSSLPSHCDSWAM